jgi:uncharacterized protein (DUF1778 family)
MDRETLVYVDLDGKPHLVGRLWPGVRKNKESASFEYDRTWLENPVHSSLDPALQAGPGAFHTQADLRLKCCPIGRTLMMIALCTENVMSRTSALANAEKGRARSSRLGFRVDVQTKRLVERAAALERRSLTDFCLTVLTEATRATISRHETILLSDRDRQVFFDALVHPPKPSARLRRAFRSAKERIVS